MDLVVTNLPSASMTMKPLQPSCAGKRPCHSSTKQFVAALKNIWLNCFATDADSTHTQRNRAPAP